MSQIGNIGTLEAQKRASVPMKTARRVNAEDVKAYIQRNQSGVSMDHTLFQILPVDPTKNSYTFTFDQTGRSSVSSTALINCEAEEFLGKNDLMIVDRIGLTLVVVKTDTGRIFAERTFPNNNSLITESCEVFYNGTIEGKTENNTFMPSIATHNFRRVPQGNEVALLSAAEFDPDWGTMDITNFQLFGGSVNQFTLKVPTFAGLNFDALAGFKICVALRLDGVLLKEFRKK